MVGTDKHSDLKTEDHNDKKNVTEQTILDVTNSDSLKITIETPDSKVSLHNDKRGEVTKPNDKPILNKINSGHVSINYILMRNCS